jgi:CBS domain-containing protein
MARKIPIRTLRIVGGDGGKAQRDTVWCPTRERSVALDDCLICPSCSDVTLAPSRSAHVRCDDLAAPPPRSAEPYLTPIAEVMSRVVDAVRADTALGAVVDLLIEHGYGGVPVVDAAGRAVGVVSKSDLVPYRDDGTRARDVMTPLAISLSEHESIGRAAALMASELIHRVPVHDNEGAVVGILTTMDVARWVGRRAGYAL